MDSKKEMERQPRRTVEFGYDGRDWWREYRGRNPNTGMLTRSSLWSLSPSSEEYFVEVKRWNESGAFIDSGFRLERGGKIHLSQRIGNRWIDVSYDESGKFCSLKYAVIINPPIDHIVSRELNFDANHQLKKPESKPKHWDSLDPNEFDWGPQETANSHTLIRQVDGQPIDEMVFPNNINVEDTLFKFAPQPLIENPHLEEEAFDSYWRGLDPVYEAGIRWVALANDQYGSLNREEIVGYSQD